MVNFGDPSNDHRIEPLNANAITLNQFRLSLSCCLCMQQQLCRGWQMGGSKSRTWTDHRQVNQLDISTHVVYSSNSVRVSFKCHSVCGACNSSIGTGIDAYAALVWRELFLNRYRGTPNDFLLNYAAALTF